MALTYHHLGTVAQQRGRLDDAQEWYLKSLATKEEVGNWPGMVTTLGQMALLAEERGQLEEAMACIIKRIILFAEFPHLADEPAGPLHLRRLTTELGVDTLDRLWHRLTGEPVPQVIRDFIASNGT
jgi:tetratricopeptide (TPR) repeat protein